MSLGLEYKGKPRDNNNPIVERQETLVLNRINMAVVDSTGINEDDYIKSTFYDIVSTIRDPEYNNTLEELKIVSPQCISLTSSLSNSP